MSANFNPRLLGRTGLTVGRLGVAGGYGAPTQAFEMAFEQGCNYFYHGSARRSGMTQAIKNLCAKGKRDELIIVAQTYSRFIWQIPRSLESFLKKTGVDYADILLLGWYNSEPPEKTLEVCRQLKSRGLFRFLGISGHHRPAFPQMAKNPAFDLFHVRYNAAHRGAEDEIFAKLPAENRHGVVVYTATRWGNLVDARRMPAGAPIPRASDCYRFVLSHPAVDVCMTGPKNLDQMKEALATLDRGPMSGEELSWMRKVGDHVHRQMAFLPPLFQHGH